MTLREWLFHNRISCEKFARIVDCSSHYIQEIKAGKRRPGKWLAKAISDHTKGAVTVKEIFDSYDLYHDNLQNPKPQEEISCLSQVI